MKEQNFLDNFTIDINKRIDKIVRLKNLLWIPIIISIALLTVYFFVFNGSVSSDNEDWNTFSSYFGLIFSLLLGTLNLYLIAVISEKQEETSKKNLELQHELSIKVTKEQNEFSLKVINRQLQWEIFKPFIGLFREEKGEFINEFSKLKANSEQLHNLTVLQDFNHKLDYIIKKNIPRTIDTTRILYNTLKSFKNQNDILFRNFKWEKLSVLENDYNILNDINLNINHGDKSKLLGYPFSSDQSKNISEVESVIALFDDFRLNTKSEIDSLQVFIIGA